MQEVIQDQDQEQSAEDQGLEQSEILGEFAPQEAKPEEPTFLTEEEVPEALRPQWREMNKRFTKTQQELAELKRELQERLEALNSPREQAQPEEPQDPVLQNLSERYQKALEEQDLQAMQEIALQFQMRAETVRMAKDLEALKKELAATKHSARVREVSQREVFRPLWSDEVEQKVAGLIERGLDPEQAAWAVLGKDVVRHYLSKAHQAARAGKELAERAATPTPAPSPKSAPGEIEVEEVMHGGRPSIAKIWQLIKERS